MLWNLGAKVSFRTGDKKLTKEQQQLQQLNFRNSFPFASVCLTPEHQIWLIHCRCLPARVWKFLCLLRVTFLLLYQFPVSSSWLWAGLSVVSLGKSTEILHFMWPSLLPLWLTIGGRSGLLCMQQYSHMATKQIISPPKIWQCYYKCK